jgi:hypothetical protein
MSEMIGSRDPPWGALSPLRGWWGAIFGVTASAIGRTDGLTVGRPALGSVD